MFEWTLNVVETGGYAGIFFLMILENIFPPIPSEVIIPVAGYAAASGELNFLLVILVASIGALVGILPWYIIGRAFGAERVKFLSGRFGRFMTFSPQDVDDAKKWFEKHGQKAVLFGRLVPTVRTLISIPAGIANMRLSTFLIFSFLGSTIWTSILAFLGYILESEHKYISIYLNPVSNAVVIGIVIYYLYRVVTYKNPN
jgi:membrane protein DedA with SNARE-associated domain